MSDIKITRTNPTEILSSLYTSWMQTQAGASYYFRDPAALKTPPVGEQLPIPPAHLRMGYATDDDASFLQGGKASCTALRSLMNEFGISLNGDTAAMDWGCATGRTLRWFEEEAHGIEFWGVDQDDASIVWVKENLSPPFHFVTCTAYPHLPFPDGKFSLIYGLSVFTHLEHFPDLWLMELHRVMQRGGHAILTVHDDFTVKYFEENGRPLWIPMDLELSEMLKHEVTIIHGEFWHQTYVFLSCKYIRKEWGKYFQILGIKPLSEGYQSAVVLRKM